MTAHLDINTPNGQRAAALQLRATEIVFGRSDAFSFVHTPTNDASAIDGFIVKAGVATGIAEAKSRDMTYEQLIGPFKGEWLLTLQKLQDIAAVSKLLFLPGYGLLYLVPSARVLVIPLTASNGNIICSYREEMTETQATCNGGKIFRENAYINVANARIYNE